MEISKESMDLNDDEFLPLSSDYHEEMRTSQEDVETHPTKYIIEECLPACKELWRKNIYTFMVSDQLNPGECWIEVIANNLSDENKEIFLSLEGDDVRKFSYHNGCINFGVTKVGIKAQKRLLELAEQFKMQDVPEFEGYLSIKDFLMRYCGCAEEIENSAYVEMKPPYEVVLSLEELVEYIQEYDKWTDSPRSHKTITVFKKRDDLKPIDELVRENNMILDGDRVYLSKFHHDKHLEYIKYLEEEKAKQK